METFKMKFLTISLLQIAVFLLISCNPADPSKGITLPVQRISVKEGAIKLSEFADQIEVIPLKSTNNNFIARINKIIVTKEYIIVVDQVLTKSIFIYDNDGNPHATIKSIGKGPGEYISIADVTVDEMNKSIIIYDNKTQKLLWFDFDSNFLREHRFAGLFVSEIACLKNKSVIIHCSQSSRLDPSGTYYPPGLLSLDTSNDSIIQLKQFGADNSGVGYSPGLYGYGDSVLFCSQYSDTLFCLGETIVPHSFLDFGKYLTPEKYYSLPQANLSINQDAGFVTGKHSFSMDEGTMFFGFTIGVQMYYCLVHRGQYFYGSWFENDLIPLKLTIPMFIKSGYIYCITTDEEMKNFHATMNSTSLNGEDRKSFLKHLFRKSNVLPEKSNNDNPYILKIKLK